MTVSSKINLLLCYTMRLGDRVSPCYPEDEGKRFLRDVGACLP